MKQLQRSVANYTMSCSELVYKIIVVATSFVSLSGTVLKTVRELASTLVSME